MHRLAPSLLRLAAATILVVSAVPAHAILLDHGPQDPTLIFPVWYRDLSGLPLQLCLSQTPSPNPLSGLKPFCFPLGADPTGFPGNLGPEVFYNNINASIGKGAASPTATGFAMKYVAGLEASYLPAGQPVHGTETVFARVRVVMNAQVAGDYKVTHPFGVEVFPNVQPGPRGVFFTADVPVGVPGNFDLALGGRIGPFIQWDFVNPGETLTVTNAAGATEEFVGDANYAHTFTGSPFGTNYIRVDGPPGSNLDGVGNDFIQTPLANVEGQKYLAPIPTPLSIKRASYMRNPATNITSIDIYATSAPGAKLIATGANLPTVALKTDGLGSFFTHLEIPATTLAPASVTISNVASNPISSASAALVDIVNITSATYDSLTGALSVTATSSDLATPPPLLSVLGPFGGAMAGGSYSALLPAGALPPARISVESTGGGADSDDVVILPGLPMNPPFAPVALPDALTTNENVAAAIDVSANDAVTPPAAAASVIVITPPASGTAVAAAAGGVVTYTPAANFFGADSFQYVLQDSAGALSNLATVAVTVNFVPVGPTANADDFALVQNKTGAPSSRTYAVLANDAAAAGTTINPASVVIVTAPLHGVATANADGTVTYTPTLSYVGADSYRYTVSNSNGIASNAATVSIVVEGGAESVSISKATYTVSKAKWTIVGSTNWFGPTLTHTTASCYVGSGTAGPLIGTAPIDTTGKFQLVPVTAPPPDATNIFTCKTSNGGQVSAVVQRI